MTHESKIIEIRKLSDSSFAALARCCDDSTTDSWHTMYISKPEEIQKRNFAEEIEQHRARVEELHAAVSQITHQLSKKYHLTD